MDQQCDILILGAGPAGLAAALAAAHRVQKIIILDDNPQAGGQIWRNGPGVALPSLARRYHQALRGQSQIQVLCSTKIIALPAQRCLLYETQNDASIIHWQKLILCNGAREQFIPFAGWTLPGVTGAGGLQAQIKQGLSVRGEKIIIAGSGPLLLACATTVRKAGGDVLLIAEQASFSSLLRFTSQLWRWPGKLAQTIQHISTCYRPASQVIAAGGQQRLQNVTLRQRRCTLTLNCDRLAIGYGLVPNIELAMLFGCHLRDDAVAVNHYQQTSITDIFAAGECTGSGGCELALIEGEIAGYAATGNTQCAEARFARRAYWQHFADALKHTFALPQALKTITDNNIILCRCEDVSCGEVNDKSDWRSAKLASRCGMGACQGRTCATIARTLYGWPIPQPREPLVPARLETLLRMQEKEGHDSG